MNNIICSWLAKRQIITNIFNFFEKRESKNFTSRVRRCAVYKYAYTTNEQYEAKYINIGDYIQSLAAKQYLPDKTPILMDRDSARYYDGEPVNLIANGWYAICKGNEVFSDKINPLFVSMHINNLKNIKQETLSYLKKYEPIGCRDFTTRNFLLLEGVKAYFSSCLTTTLDKDYKVSESERNDKIIFCDYEINREKPTKIDKKLLEVLKNYNKEAIEYTHHSYDFGLSEEECFKTAETLLQKYARAKLVITTRIHCALPCLALGTPVILVIPKKYDKKRYDGLTQLLNIIGYDRHKFIINKIEKDKNGLVINSKKYLQYAKKLKATASLFINAPEIKTSVKDKQYGGESGQNTGILNFLDGQNPPKTLSGEGFGGGGGGYFKLIYFFAQSNMAFTNAAFA